MLNRKNWDGSVNGYHEVKKPGFGYSVPHLHPDLKNQVEPGIWPTVKVLVAKGYSTITSCAGHSKFMYRIKKGIRYNDGPQVTISLKSKEEVKIFVEKIENRFIEAKRNKTMGSHLNISIRCKNKKIPFPLARLILWLSVLKL